MKKIVVLVAMMVAGSAFADGHDFKKMDEKLGLSEAQKTQVQEIRKKNKEECKALREKHRAEVRAILTPEQAVKFDAMKAEKMEHRMEQRKDKKMDKKELKQLQKKGKPDSL